MRRSNDLCLEICSSQLSCGIDELVVDEQREREVDVLDSKADKGSSRQEPRLGALVHNGEIRSTTHHFTTRQYCINHLSSPRAAEFECMIAMLDS